MAFSDLTNIINARTTKLIQFFFLRPEERLIPPGFFSKSFPGQVGNRSCTQRYSTNFKHLPLCWLTVKLMSPEIRITDWAKGLCYMYKNIFLWERLVFSEMARGFLGWKFVLSVVVFLFSGQQLANKHSNSVMGKFCVLTSVQLSVGRIVLAWEMRASFHWREVKSYPKFSFLKTTTRIQTGINLCSVKY